MARKRKIPVRKHHGIRDPLKQLETKEKKLANVVNSPPVKGDDQQISYKFTQFKKLADAAKAGKKIKRIPCGQEDKPKIVVKKGRAAGGNRAAASGNSDAASANDNKMRNIKQFADETDEDYLRRVNRITNASIREAQYEAKYGVSVLRNSKTGEIIVQKRPKNEIDELLKQKQKEQRLSKMGKVRKKAKHEPMDAKTAKELIKRAIKEDEEEKKAALAAENGKLQEYKRDIVQFGEIVHAPPTLSALPRKAAKPETVPRPGKKNNLLLKSMLEQQVVPDKSINKKNKLSQKSNPGTTTITKAQLRGKRKELPTATRTMLETERSKMIEIYRQLKKSKEAAN